MEIGLVCERCGLTVLDPDAKTCESPAECIRRLRISRDAIFAAWEKVEEQHGKITGQLITAFKTLDPTDFWKSAMMTLHVKPGEIVVVRAPEWPNQQLSRVLTRMAHETSVMFVVTTGEVEFDLPLKPLPGDMVGITCDWGSCNRPAVALRSSKENGDLPVCAVCATKADPSPQSDSPDA